MDAAAHAHRSSLLCPPQLRECAAAMQYQQPQQGYPQQYDANGQPISFQSSQYVQQQPQQVYAVQQPQYAQQQQPQFQQQPQQVFVQPQQQQGVPPVQYVNTYVNQPSSPSANVAPLVSPNAASSSMEISNGPSSQQEEEKLCLSVGSAQTASYR